MPMLPIVVEELQHARQYLTKHSLAHSAKWYKLKHLGLASY
jgi:hypothetical protein